MPLNFKNHFEATSRSTREFLSKLSEGIAIPAYQRAYSWDEQNFARLFEDLEHGLDRLLDQEQTSSYLGTLITVDDSHNSRKRRLDPSTRLDIRTIVDGQQRISTLVMCNIAIHDRIRRLSTRLPQTSEPHYSWLRDQSTIVRNALETTYRIDTALGHHDHRYLPKIARELDDVWSTHSWEAQFQSPISCLIWEYLQHSDSEPGQQFSFVTRGSPYTATSKAFSSIVAKIGRLTNGKETQHLPDLMNASEKCSFFNTIWPSAESAEVRDSVSAYLERTNPRDKTLSVFCQLMRLTMLSHYLNERIAITVVTAPDADDALDIFDALNTTGTPLTAFETFKPRVVEFKGEHYIGSESRQHIANLDDHFAGILRADTRQRATSEVLIPFALSETGRKLSRRPGEQRRYLHKEYDALCRSNVPNGPDDFVKALAGVSGVLWNAWSSKGGACPFPGLDLRDDHRALICLQVLRDLKHSVTIAPIVRFYQCALDAPTDAERTKRTCALGGALAATLAFSVLWRGANRGTAGLDDCYRTVMAGSPKESIQALARRSDGANVSLADYKGALAGMFFSERSFGSKDAWCTRASRLPVYGESTVLARFLLFSALHETVVDTSDPGLVVAGQAGLPALLSPDKWRKEEHATVEHIAPQSKSEGWTDELYADSETVNRLGNLTLLPRVENAVAGTKSWEDKRSIYDLWASRAGDEFARKKKVLVERGILPPDSVGTEIDRSGFLAACESLAHVSQPWSTGMVEKRGRRLAELAWRRLSPWLFSESTE